MAFSTYTSNKILEEVTGKVDWIKPTIYIGFSSTLPTVGGTNITEPSGAGYARVATSGATWATATAGSITNATDITFAKATGSWLAGANLPYIVLYDDATTGNFIGWGTTTTPIPVGTNNIPILPAGQVTISLS